ncbi:MAG: hypothetical protein LBM05_02285 [Endomicrobium sp.]|jgi:hypothetical protein|nr:hypothetical protein [Endomicrobium sp.]
MCVSRYKWLSSSFLCFFSLLLFYCGILHAQCTENVGKGVIVRNECIKSGGKQVICGNNIVKNTIIINSGVQSFVDDNDIGIFASFDVINRPLVKNINRNNSLINVLVKDKGKVLLPQFYGFKN